MYPTDYCLVAPAETAKKTKNEHVRDMLGAAKGRGLAPRYVCFDAWYSGQENRKAIRDHGWHFLTQVRSNRRVDLDRTGNKAIHARPIASTGTVVHVEGFGLVTAESLAAGTPVIVTPVGGLASVVAPLASELVTPSASSHDIAVTIARALLGELCLPDADACAAYAGANFTWPVMTRRVRDVYELARDR